MVKTAAERVKAGAALLDRKRPGWANKVVAETLDMREGEQCVLGQIFGDFDAGLRKIGAMEGDARLDLGFTTDYLDRSRTRSHREEEHELKTIWLAEVYARPRSKEA